MAFGDDAIAAGRKWLGTTYAWGGGDINGPTRGIRDGGTADRHGDYKKVGFDCSGLTLYAVYQASKGQIRLPHRADQQARMGSAVSASQVAPGDLIAFSSDGGRFYHHIGIYVGNGNLLNAPQSGDVVKISSVSGWAGETKAYRRFGAPGGAVTSPTAIRSAASPSYGGSPTGLDGAGAPTVEPLPAIGPAQAHALIPITGAPYYDLDWNRLGEVRLNGAGMTADLAVRVVSAQMSYSVSQIGQFTMVFADPDGQILESGIIAKNTSLDFGDQHLEVLGLDVRASAGGPQLTVKARSRVIGVLTGDEHRGRGTWGEQPVDAWVQERGREAGAHVVVQPDLGTYTFNRDSDSATTWDTMVGAANALGCWCFEHEQVVTFAKPAWLADRVRTRWWELRWAGNNDYTPGLVGQPDYSWSVNGADMQESLSFQLVSGDAKDARPGQGVSMSGPIGGGDWVMTQVNDPVTSTSPVGVTCTRVVDLSQPGTTQPV